MIDSYREVAVATGGGGFPAVHFAPREQDIMRLVAEGLGDKQIATRLGVSIRTIRTHFERLFRRHNIHSRTAALSLWMRTGGAATAVTNFTTPELHDAGISRRRNFTTPP
ncbi:MAG: response regulator transcription factor [Pseudonocardiaceae bacterium]